MKIMWKENQAFEADVNGHVIRMDVGSDMGGDDSGPRPKPLLLAALGGCSGLDVLAILKKMKVKIDSFSIDADAHQTDEHPRVYDKIHLVYRFKGDDLDINKLHKAVSLSQERYCGVAAMLNKSAEITFEIVID